LSFIIVNKQVPKDGLIEEIGFWWALISGLIEGITVNNILRQIDLWFGGECTDLKIRS
jgi:hypothetical protein